MSDASYKDLSLANTSRLISSSFPASSILDTMVDPAELELIHEIADQPFLVGDVTLILPDDRIVGTGTTPVMSAFTFPGKAGSRFSAGEYGVWYAGLTLDVAVDEVTHHVSKFLLSTNEPTITIDKRLYSADLVGRLADIRGKDAQRPELYDRDDYSAAQAFAREVRGPMISAEGGSVMGDGIIYDSARHPGGQCVAAFRPPVVQNCSIGPVYGFDWDGATVTNVYLKAPL